MKVSFSDLDIVKSYNNGKSLRAVAKEFGTDHHTIKRVLTRQNVPIVKKKLPPFTDEHKRKISESRRKLFREGKIISWSKDQKMSNETNLKNMAAHLKYDVSVEWLRTFDDVEKLKYLNRAICRKRDCGGFTTQIYIDFIERFYYDEKFNVLYSLWKESGDKWMKPSLDHIIPKSSGGTLGLDNLQFISWLENRTKNDIPLDDWKHIKKNIERYFV